MEQCCLSREKSVNSKHEFTVLGFCVIKSVGTPYAPMPNVLQFQRHAMVLSAMHPSSISGRAADSRSLKSVVSLIPSRSRCHPSCEMVLSASHRGADGCFQGKGARYSRNVDVALFFNRSAHFVGQLARDLDGIDALDIVVQALPLGDPRLGGVGERNEALVDLAGTVVDGIWVAFQVEELFAVGTAFLSKTLYGGGS